MADYEDASVLAFTEVFGNNVLVKGCWFHFSNAVIKRVQTLGLANGFRCDPLVRKCVKALTCLPLLPHDKIVEALDLLIQYAADIPAQYKDKIDSLFEYIRRRWVEYTPIGVERLSVFGSSERTNNSAECFHSRFKRRVKVAHPNIFTFLRHLRDVAIDLMCDVVRLQQHRRIKRNTPLKHRKYGAHLKRCAEKLIQGGYRNVLDYLFAVCHCTDNITLALDIDDGEETEYYTVEDNDESETVSDQSVTPASNTDNLCDICWVAERAKLVFVPCGHSRFCQSCANTCFSSSDRKCAVCRARIDLVMPIFN
jgi:hypothetical protein